MNGLSALVLGVAVIAGTEATVNCAWHVSPVMAQGRAGIAYDETNLAGYGVPNTDLMTPASTKWIDKTDYIAGKETRLDIYEMQGGIIGVYSLDGRIFSVAVDPDAKPPVDRGYIDVLGDGQFVEMPGTKPFSVPQWLLR